MNHDHSNTNSSTHLWIMLACCLIPLALILAIGVFGISLGSLTPLLPFALFLLCPLMMFFMMRGMGHEHGMADTHHADNTPKKSLIPPLDRGRDAAAVTETASADAASILERCH